MEDNQVILWIVALLRPCDFGKRYQGIVADDMGNNDTFIALWIHDNPIPRWYPMHSDEK
jgi:hypothetical protein